MGSSGTAPRKLGRPSLGDRVGTHVALPRDFRLDIEEMAKQDGVTLGAIITRLVADGLGKPAPDYCKPVEKDQTELPIDSQRQTVEEPLQKSA